MSVYPIFRNFSSDQPVFGAGIELWSSGAMNALHISGIRVVLFVDETMTHDASMGMVYLPT